MIYTENCKPFNILLISTYELGRQPFGLASPAAWLREAGAEVHSLDLAIDKLDEAAVRAADMIAFYLPMHMATRMAVPLIEYTQRLNGTAHLCCFGLYAPVNADYLDSLGVDTILGGEFESSLVILYQQLSTEHPPIPQPLNLQSPNPPISNLPTSQSPPPPPTISLDRQQFRTPDRSDLPDLRRYAQLVLGNQPDRPVGYTEASRGCKHLCRHCPIVPVYGGRFRIVQREVVLADIRQQVAAGAQHITFGDPDFFNGPGHAIPLVEALHEEFPDVTYDVTIKVEHLLKQARHLPTLKETGCLFITTAVESFDENMLRIFEKHHTREEFEAALTACRRLDLMLIPTFVAFTPWTTLAGYRHFLAEIARLGLIEQVAPIQYALRLLIPPGSRLLELPETQAVIGPLDEAKLSYEWHNPAPRVDQLQQDVEQLVDQGTRQNLSRHQIFQQIWQRAYRNEAEATAIPAPKWPVYQGFVPYLTEPWYC